MKNIRRLFRFATVGLCVLSLAACLAAGWLWWRSYRKDASKEDRIVWQSGLGRNTLRSEQGRILLFRPPPLAPDPEGAVRRALSGMRNDDVMLIFDNLGRQGDFHVHAAINGMVPAMWADRLSDAEATRPLLDALERPDQWAIAHVLLAERYIKHEPYSVRPVRRDGIAIVDWRGLPFEAQVQSWSWTSTEELEFAGAVDRVDPSGLIATRNYWHDRLDVPVWSVPYWQPTLAFALPPLLWLGLRVWRRQVLRHRRGLGLCAVCGYDLRGSSGRCPECGAADREGVATGDATRC